MSLEPRVGGGVPGVASIKIVGIPVNQQSEEEGENVLNNKREREKKSGRTSGSCMCLVAFLQKLPAKGDHPQL